VKIIKGGRARKRLKAQVPQVKKRLMKKKKKKIMINNPHHLLRMKMQSDTLKR
jgi:hypothetical protein